MGILSSFPLDLHLGRTFLVRECQELSNIWVVSVLVFGVQNFCRICSLLQLYLLLGILLVLSCVCACVCVCVRTSVCSCVGGGETFPSLTHQRGTVGVGVDVPRLVVGGELEVVLRYVLVAAAAALRRDARHHLTVAQVDAQALLVVRDARRPRTATWRGKRARSMKESTCFVPVFSLLKPGSADVLS